MTKLWEVSDETSTDRFPHFQCLTLQSIDSSVTRRLSVFGQGVGSGARVASGSQGRGRGWLTSEVSLGVGGGGVFPETTLDFLDSLQTRPDPTRPRPRSPIFISYPPSDRREAR